MHIALCHDAVIPPKKYGGTERIVAWLARALLHLGHKVTLIAREGSFVEGARMILHPINGDWEAHLPTDVDLTHLWSTPARTPKTPYVVTIEGNGQPGEAFLPNTLFISRRHAENHGAVHYVYNGIDVNDYECHSQRGDYLVFLAKASWKVKNLKGAVAIARAARMRLEVCGSHDWPLGLHKLLPAYRGVHFRGMVGDDEKRKILSRARALLFPVRWHEPFGIAITEALASGCPVFGTPYGSLPEIVTPETGVLSANGLAMVAALSDMGRFDPKKCRARVSEGFTHIEMARGYLAYYQNVLEKGRLGDEPNPPPKTREGFRSEELLPWESP